MSTSRNRLPRRIFIATTAALLVAVTGCSTGTNSGGTSDTVEPTGEVTGAGGELLDLTQADPDNLGTDLKIPVGVVLPLSGPATYYGKYPLNAIRLAFAQIKAAGGPEFVMDLKDHKSGDATAGVQVTRELVDARVPAAIYSFAAVNGSALPGIEEGQILSLDGIGGTGAFAQEQKYFFGTRSIVPGDTYAGVAEYVKEAYPDVDKVAAVIADYSADNTKSLKSLIGQSFEDQGIEVVAEEITQPGATDFSSVITKLKASDADLIISAQFGADPGVLVKQYKGSGGNKPIIGCDFNTDMVAAAGDALTGFEFGTEYFGEVNADNPLGQYFLDTYADQFPGEAAPDVYAAGAYTDALILWTLVQRTLAAGGDVMSGEDLRQAMVADLTFQSLYGTGGTGVDIEIDPETHTLSKGFLGVFSVGADGEVGQKASFDIGGAEFALTE